MASTGQKDMIRITSPGQLPSLSYMWRRGLVLDCVLSYQLSNMSFVLSLHYSLCPSVSSDSKFHSQGFILLMLTGKLINIFITFHCPSRNYNTLFMQSFCHDGTLSMYVYRKSKVILLSCFFNLVIFIILFLISSDVHIVHKNFLRGWVFIIFSYICYTFFGSIS